MKHCLKCGFEKQQMCICYYTGRCKTRCFTCVDFYRRALIDCLKCGSGFSKPGGTNFETCWLNFERCWREIRKFEILNLEPGQLGLNNHEVSKLIELVNSWGI